MALLSVVGALVLGVLHGQLSTEVVDGMVVAVGGTSIDPLPAARYDLWGLWIAAVPAVIWGAPLGTIFVHSLNERHLITFLAAMASIEVVSTAIFLQQLRTDPWLLTYAVLGLVVAILSVKWLHSRRDRLLGAAAPSLVEEMLRKSVEARWAERTPAP